MKFLTQLILITCLLAVVGGAFFLATWSMPAPSAQIEKTVPADRYKP